MNDCLFSIDNEAFSLNHALLAFLLFGVMVRIVDSILIHRGGQGGKDGPPLKQLQF